jgi:hypothetical protein
MIRKFVGLHIILALSACSSLYDTTLPDGMTLYEFHYSDPQELARACGDANACAFVNSISCAIHLPLAANGDPMYRDHELRHCSGGLDAPKAVKRHGV